MTIYTKKVWPVQDLAAVCQTQNMTANTPAILNGTLASPLNNQISFVNQGFIRVVSITSANDLSLAVFTILGLQNGVPVMDIVLGPNNSTVYGIVAFDVITSVTSVINVNGVSVGTGDTGYLPPFAINNSGPGLAAWNMSVVLPLVPASGITFQDYLTIDPIINNGMSFDNMITKGYLYQIAFEDQQASQDLPTIGLVAEYVLMTIVTSTTPATDTLIASCLQAGS